MSATNIGAEGAPAIVIRVKDVGGTVKGQSKAGGLLYDLTPGTMSGIVYSTMRDEIAKGLAEKGVPADVTVTTSPPSGPPPKSEFLRGAAIGAGAVGGVWLIVKLIKHLRGK